MKSYQIIYSEQARKDLIDLAIAIRLVYKSPLTSKKYIDGIRTKIRSLNSLAESYLIQKHPFFRQYGFNVRTIRYKKMTIVYLVENHIVYIKAVIPSAMVRGL